MAGRRKFIKDAGLLTAGPGPDAGNIYSLMRTDTQ